MNTAERIVRALLETGEADQDYDHGPWDAIVRELDYNGVKGATHKEFDKYQGVYLRVPHVGRFWLDHRYEGGEIMPLILEASISDEMPHGITVTVNVWEMDNDEWNADVEELTEFCKTTINKKIASQIARNAVDSVIRKMRSR